MIKVIIDEDPREDTKKPHYIAVDLKTGKTMYIAGDIDSDAQERYWNNPDFVYSSIYSLLRALKKDETPAILGGVLGSVDSIKEAVKLIALNDMLE